MLPMARNHRGVKRTDWQDAFLDVLAKTGRQYEACDAAGVGKVTVWNERQRDEAFALRYTEALERYAEAVRAEVNRRAMGWVETTVDKDGNEITVHKHSDVLLIFEAKRVDPSYRDTFRHEHVGPDGGPIQIQAPPDAVERSTRAAQLLAQAGAIDGDAEEIDELPPASGNGRG